METIKIAEEIDHRRRRFFGAAAMTIAAAQLGMSGSAAAQTNETKVDLPAIKPGTNTSFASLTWIAVFAGRIHHGFRLLRSATASMTSAACSARRVRLHY